MTWINDGEKYGLIGLNLKLEGEIPSGPIAPDLWISTDPFRLPAHWQEWLGTIRTQAIEACNLFLISKVVSASPEILNTENSELEARVWRFYVALLLASRFSPAQEPVLLTGSACKGAISVQQERTLEVPVPRLFRRYPPVVADDILTAAQLSSAIEAISCTTLPEGHWRFFRTLFLYAETRTIRDILERLHQYCRCIDGLILPDAGNTKRQFKSRSELFIGPRHHDLMGEIYDVRSAAEHLHENRYLEAFDRETRLDLVKKEALAEGIARRAIMHILSNPSLWPHFANTTALARFWALDETERRRLWGTTFDMMEPVSGLEPAYIHDGLLGAD